MDYYGVNECASVLLIKERFATSDSDVDDDASAGLHGPGQLLVFYQPMNNLFARSRYHLKCPPG